MIEYDSVTKKDGITSFAGTRMDPEMTIRVKSDREREIPYGGTYMRKMKHGRKQTHSHAARIVVTRVTTGGKDCISGLVGASRHT